MEWVTEQADIRCGHDGRVANQASRRWVTVAGAPLLVERDPPDRPIAGCPNYGPTIKPCVKTLVVSAGHSVFVRIDGGPVVLSTLEGLTDGTPPGTVQYLVRDPGQRFVSADR